jgi:hypothetical protein
MLHTLLASVLSLAAAQQSTPGAPPTPVAPAPAATPAPPAAPGGSTDPSATRRAPNPQAAAILARSLMPAPHVARMERALAIAGLGERFTKDAVTAAAAQATAGYATWRATAEPTLTESIRAAVDSDPGLGFPRRCKAQIIAAWDEGAAFERDAFGALVSSALPDGDAAGTLARAALAAGQAQALRSTLAYGPLVDFWQADMLESSLRAAAGASVSPDQLREMLSGYESERARLLRDICEAVLEAESRRRQVLTMAAEWYRNRAGASADMVRMPGAMQVAEPLINATLVDAGARMAAFQRRTAQQVAGVLATEGAWSVSASLLASGRKDSPAVRIDPVVAAIAELPEDRREEARTMLREFCTTDRAAMQKTVDAAVDALEMQARIVKPAQRVEAIVGLDLDALDAQLRAVPTQEAAYGTLSALDARKRAVSELERKIRALAETETK